jgi:hypothetical protein
MRKLVILALVIAAAVVGWKFYGGGATGDDALADLEHRLQAAERAYQSAGRSAGMSGMDTTADAEAALAEVDRVEKALRDMSRNTTSAEVKNRIHRLLDQVATVKRKIG